MPNMKDLSLRVKKLWPMLKFFDGQTDRRTDRQTEGRTDRVITIGHPPSGGALTICFSFCNFRSSRVPRIRTGSVKIKHDLYLRL